MTFQEMIDFVRLHADADQTDAPSSNLTVYARMAYNDILSRQTAWPHLEVRYTFATVAGQQDYPIGAFSGADLSYVSSIQDNVTGDRLFPIFQSDADRLYTATSTGYAATYTLRNNTVVLWPKPSIVRTYVVRGQRAAAAWPGASGSIPDLPREFDELICWFMLAQYYMSQEDLDLHQMYMGMYERSVRMLVGSEVSKRLATRPAIMGANSNWTPRSLMGRIRQWTE